MVEPSSHQILQLAETPSPFSVAVFNDQLFWSDTKRRTIRSADKNTGKEQKVLLKRPGQPFGLKVSHHLLMLISFESFFFSNEVQKVFGCIIYYLLCIIMFPLSTADA